MSVCSALLFVQTLGSRGEWKNWESRKGHTGPAAPKCLLNDYFSFQPQLHLPVENSSLTRQREPLPELQPCSGRLDGESTGIVLIYPRVRCTCLGKWKVASFYANEVPGRYDSKKFGGEEQEVFFQFKLSQGKASHEEHGGGVEWTEEER